MSIGSRKLVIASALACSVGFLAALSGCGKSTFQSAPVSTAPTKAPNTDYSKDAGNTGNVEKQQDADTVAKTTKDDHQPAVAADSGNDNTNPPAAGVETTGKVDSTQPATLLMTPSIWTLKTTTGAVVEKTFTLKNNTKAKLDLVKVNLVQAPARPGEIMNSDGVAFAEAHWDFKGGSFPGEGGSCAVVPTSDTLCKNCATTLEAGASCTFVATFTGRTLPSATFQPWGGQGWLTGNYSSAAMPKSVSAQVNFDVTE